MSRKLELSLPLPATTQISHISKQGYIKTLKRVIGKISDKSSELVAFLAANLFRFRKEILG